MLSFNTSFIRVDFLLLSPFGCAWGNLFFLTGLFQCQVLVLKGWGRWGGFDLLHGKCIWLLFPSLNWEGGRDGGMEERRKRKLLPVQQQLSHPVCLCHTRLSSAVTKSWVLQEPDAEKVPDFSLYILSGTSLILAGIPAGTVFPLHGRSAG